MFNSHLNTNTLNTNTLRHLLKLSEPSHTPPTLPLSNQLNMFQCQSILSVKHHEITYKDFDLLMVVTVLEFSPQTFTVSFGLWVSRKQSVSGKEGSITKFPNSIKLKLKY